MKVPGVTDVPTAIPLLTPLPTPFAVCDVMNVLRRCRMGWASRAYWVIGLAVVVIACDSLAKTMCRPLAHPGLSAGGAGAVLVPVATSICGATAGSKEPAAMTYSVE
ncbi:hypothetical protein D9M70_649080 [compost metagenome]